MKNLRFPYDKLMFSRFWAFQKTSKKYVKQRIQQGMDLGSEKGGFGEDLGSLWHPFHLCFGNVGPSNQCFFSARLWEGMKEDFGSALGPPLARHKNAEHCGGLWRTGQSGMREAGIRYLGIMQD